VGGGWGGGGAGVLADRAPRVAQGTLDVGELRAALSSACPGVALEEADVLALLGQLDAGERDGVIDFDEFTAAFRHLRAHEIDARQLGAGLLAIHQRIAAERAAAAAAQAATRESAAELRRIEQALREADGEREALEAGLQEMALVRRPLAQRPWSPGTACGRGGAGRGGRVSGGRGWAGCAAG
jgi:hypothetical protein